MVYDIASDSCKHFFQNWKPAFLWMKVNVLATYTVSSHEYTLSEHTAVAHSADSFHLATFPTTNYAQP